MATKKFPPLQTFQQRNIHQNVCKFVHKTGKSQCTKCITVFTVQSKSAYMHIRELQSRTLTQRITRLVQPRCKWQSRRQQLIVDNDSSNVACRFSQWCNSLSRFDFQEAKNTWTIFTKSFIMNEWKLQNFAGGMVGGQGSPSWNFGRIVAFSCFRFLLPVARVCSRMRTNLSSQTASRMPPTIEASFMSSYAYIRHSLHHGRFLIRINARTPIVTNIHPVPSVNKQLSHGRGTARARSTISGGGGQFEAKLQIEGLLFTQLRHDAIYAYASYGKQTISSTHITLLRQLYSTSMITS